MSQGDLKKRAAEIHGLVKKSQTGDTEAFAQLYDILVDPIYRYLYYKVDRNEVEDLTESVFLRVWENLPKYRKGKTPFTAWVFRIAHNLVIDYYRLNKAVRELDETIPDQRREHNPIMRLEDSLSRENLRAAIGKLKETYQQVIVLKFINDLSNEEIAKTLKKRPGSIRVLQFRALKALKQILQGMGVKY